MATDDIMRAVEPHLRGHDGIETHHIIATSLYLKHERLEPVTSHLEYTDDEALRIISEGLRHIPQTCLLQIRRIVAASNAE